MSLFIDYHVVQTIPPANINRDEDGSPKTATFGGTRRARVSSQAWKRAIRKDFTRHLDQSELGVRSLRLVDGIAAVICGIDPALEDSSQALAASVLNAAGIKTEKSKPRKESDSEFHKTGALLFLSNPQIAGLAELATRNPDGKITKSDARKVLGEGNSIDLALFGRMIADTPDLNVDAAAQVAHAIGVHQVVPEFDYFTAVDDVKQEDNAGAGMIGTVEFNASTLYRYATVNVSALAANLGSVDATARAVEAFTRSFITSMPTGKQNTFANRTLPEFVLAVVRDDQPINLAGAFEDAIIEVGDRARLAASRLAARAIDLDKQFGLPPLSAYAIERPSEPVATEYAEGVDLPGLVAKLSIAARERMAEPA